MALIKCPECGKEISSSASACPNCGHPVKASAIAPAQREGPFMQTLNCGCVVIAVLLLFVLVVALIAGAGH